MSRSVRRLVNAWRVQTRRSMVSQRFPEPAGDRVVLAATSRPLMLADGTVALGQDDADRLRGVVRRSGSLPGLLAGRSTSAEREELGRLGLELIRAFSAGHPQDEAGAGADKGLAGAIGMAVARSRYRRVIHGLRQDGAISPQESGRLLAAPNWEHSPPDERLVQTLAGTLEPRRRPAVDRADEPLLARVHADPRPDKAIVTAEIVVGGSRVLQSSPESVRSDATSDLAALIAVRFEACMEDVRLEPEASRGDRAEHLGRVLGEEVRSALRNLERNAGSTDAAAIQTHIQADGQADGQADVRADTARAVSLTADGVPGAGTPTGTEARGAGDDAAAQSSVHRGNDGMTR